MLPESQCGFRAGWSTTDMIFTLRQLQAKAIEQQQPLFVVFIDFSKAFDTVDRVTLWKVLELYGCPQKIINMIKLFHDDMTGNVVVGGDVSSPFNINHGVKQECVLAPTLFTLYLAAVLETMCHWISKEVSTSEPEQVGNYSISPGSKHPQKQKEQCVRELLYADDSALVATDPVEMQEIVDHFSAAASLFGLKINVSKTELFY